jgi:hypothetical protein
MIDPFPRTLLSAAKLGGLIWLKGMLSSLRRQLLLHQPDLIMVYNGGVTDTRR